MRAKRARRRRDERLTRTLAAFSSLAGQTRASFAPRPCHRTRQTPIEGSAGVGATPPTLRRLLARLLLPLEQVRRSWLLTMSCRVSIRSRSSGRGIGRAAGNPPQIVTAQMVRGWPRSRPGRSWPRGASWPPAHRLPVKVAGKPVRASAPKAQVADQGHEWGRGRRTWRPPPGDAVVLVVRRGDPRRRPPRGPPRPRRGRGRCAEGRRRMSGSWSKAPGSDGHRTA